MRKDKSIFPMAAIALMIATQSAKAEGTWYAGAALGVAHHAISAGDWNDGSIQDGSVDQRGTGEQFFVGYRLRPRMRMELAWVDLGKATFDGVSSGGSVWDVGDVHGVARSRGLSASLAGTQPLGSFVSVYAKAGLFAWDSYVIDTPTLGGSTISNSSSGRTKVNNDSVRPTYGVGTEIRLHTIWHLRASWDHYDVDYARTGAKRGAFAVNLISIGLVGNIH